MSTPLADHRGAEFARIMAVGAYRPSRVVTNAEICTQIDSTDEWIQDRSGIIERRFAALDESVVDMATAAAEQAISRSGVAATDIGMVMIATVTHPYPTPSAAAEVASRLGATNAAAVDISAACAGFCYGVALANDMVRGGSATYVIVIGVEKLTDWVDPTDRGTAFLFADGAGAVVVGPSDVAAIGPTVWGADGAQKDAITMTQSLVDYRNNGGPIFPVLTMQGQQVFRWAIGDMSRAAQRALDAAGVGVDDLDAFIPHQANNRITDSMVKALKLPATVAVARDITTTGNTSAASVPLAMARLLETGEAKSGDTALLIGFGAGLVYAAQVVTLP
jgi:3-oxoacyl-[acyl-carrier-protein] synthase-3